MSPRQSAEYMRDYRLRNPDVYNRGREARNAYRRALVTLKNLHPAQFAELLNRERAAIGMPPVGTLKPGRKPKAA